MSENVLTIVNNYKKQIANLLKNKPKKMNDELMNILCEIDDMKAKLDYNVINVNKLFIKESSEIFKELKRILFLDESFEEFKEIASRLLKNFFRIMKRELFDNTNELKKLNSVSAGEFLGYEFNEISSKEYEECMIRTDAKYLAEVKRMEMNIFLENKRRVKYAKLQDDERHESSSGDSVMSRKRRRDEEGDSSTNVKLLRSAKNKDVDVDTVVGLYMNSECVNKAIRGKRNVMSSKSI
jgi:hypothetical protein